MKRIKRFLAVAAALVLLGGCGQAAEAVGENSYELALSTVVGETTEVEKAIQEAMLLSFTQDESSHVLCTEDYQPGESEWDFAMAALLAENERLLAFWTEDGCAIDVSGKTTTEYIPYALALGEFEPGAFSSFRFGERPEELRERSLETLTFYFPDAKLWLYFYEDSPWVCLDLAGKTWWTQVSGPEANPYDTAMAWAEAGRVWAEG